VQVLVGDWAARTVADEQPVKLAALEGLGQTTTGAPVHVGGWYSDGEVHFGLPIPRLLSILAAHDPTATIRGLSSFPVVDLPPVNVVRLAFQTMVGLGLAMALLAVCYLWVRFRRGRLPRSAWFYRAVVLAGPAAVVALVAGWVTTEVGRQPWVVYAVMRTEDAVTGASGIPVGYGVLAVVYLGLAVAVWWILRRLAGKPFPEHPSDVPEEVGVP
jgi:cytochrome d ubiquinol oxidase subunit I